MAGTARDLAFPHSEISPPVKGDGLRAVPVYHMRAVLSGNYVRWENEYEPDRSGRGPNAPAGTLTDIIVERVTERLVDPELTDDFLWAWNGRDLSQFELVYGNGVGGHGSGADFVVSVSTFPNDDVPCISIQNANSNSNFLIYLIKDYQGTVPSRMQVAWRHLLNATGVIDFGLITYYEDPTHWFGVRSTFVQDVGITEYNGASGLVAGAAQIIGETADTSGNRDTTHGDVRAATILQSFASGSAAPWYVGGAGGELQQSYIETGSDFRRTKALTQASQNADWLGLGSYNPRIGFFVQGFGGSGTDQFGGLVMRSAFGGV